MLAQYTSDGSTLMAVVNVNLSAVDIMQVSPANEAPIVLVFNHAVLVRQRDTVCLTEMGVMGTGIVTAATVTAALSYELCTGLRFLTDGTFFR